MLKLKLIRRTHYLSLEDDLAIETIQARYGLSTHSDAVRYAVRRLAESPPATLPVAKKRAGKPA